MGNKTIYVKDEELWTRAKQLAGKDGLSAVIAAALAEYVRRKESEAVRYASVSLRYEAQDEADRSRIVAFIGREIARQTVRTPLAEYEVVVHETKGGRFVVHRGTDSHCDYYRAYESLQELAEDDAVASLGPDASSELMESLVEQIEPDATEWIS